MAKTKKNEKLSPVTVKNEQPRLKPAESAPTPSALRDPHAQIVSILGTLLDGFRSLKTTA